MPLLSLQRGGSAGRAASTAPVYDTALPPPAGDGLDTLEVYLAGRQYQGNPTFVLDVNGQQAIGTSQVSAVWTLDDVQRFTARGAFGASPLVAVSFTNDLYGGTPQTDRDLFLQGFVYGGAPRRDLKRALTFNRTLSFTLDRTIQPARRVAAFTNTLGVAVHDYDGTVYGGGGVVYTGQIVADMDYLGFRNLRWSVPEDTRIRNATAAFRDAGRRMCIVLGPTMTPAAITAALDNIQPYVSSIVGIEGPNEVNLFSSSWNGVNSPASWRAFQQEFWTQVRGRSAFNGVRVYPFTIAGVGIDAYQQYGDLSAWSNAGNIHCYFPNNRAPNEVVQYSLGLMAVSNPGQAAVFTETGYATSVPTTSTTESVQGKQSLNLALDAFQYGVEGIYFYELYDVDPDPGFTWNDAHYGLFRNDRTAKPAAVAFHNLSTIIADNGAARETFTPGRLWYEVTGTAGSTGTLLLQRSDGDFLLIVWSEPEIWDDVAKQELTFPNRPMTVGFYGTKGLVEVYDTAAGTSPVAAYANVSSVVVSVRDHPVVLRVRP